MEIKSLLQFQISELDKQDLLLSESILSGGQAHRITDLVNAYFSELTKERDSSELLLDFGLPLDKKSSGDYEWFSVFGKSIQDIIFNLDNFEADYPKFAKAVALYALSEKRYEPLLSKYDAYEITLIDSAIPFIFSNFNYSRREKTPIYPNTNSLNTFYRIYNALLSELPESKRAEFLSYLSGIYSARMRAVNVKNFGLEVFVPIPNNASLYEIDGKTSSVSVLENGYGDADVSYSELSEDLDEVKKSEENGGEILSKFSQLQENAFEKSKFKLTHLPKNSFFKQDAQLFEAYRLFKKDSSGSVKPVQCDITISFDYLQTQSVVVDIFEFAALYCFICAFNNSESINLFTDEAGDYLYISSNDLISSTIQNVKVIDGEVFTNKKDVVRVAFGRIPIKKSGYSTLNYYLWAYRYEPKLTIAEILSAMSEEDLTSISIPDDFLNQKHILNEKQKTLSEKIEKELHRSPYQGNDLLNLMEQKASGYITTYAEYDEDSKKILPKNDNVGMLLQDGTNYKNYIYKVNEIFWQNNPNITVREMIAYFIAKGDSFNYRLLSVRILGYDAYVFKDRVVQALLLEGLLCIEDFSLNADIKEIITPMKLAYKYEYVTGNYYEKARKLRIGLSKGDIDDISDEKLDLYGSIIAYFGKEVGSAIIQVQSSWLNQHKPIEMIVNGKEKDGNLLMPSLYDSRMLKSEDVEKSCEYFYDEKSYRISKKEILDLTITPNDIQAIYFHRMKLRDYAVIEFDKNIFYEIAIGYLDSGERTYNIVSKKNNKIIYAGVGKTSEDREKDCVEYATKNLNYKSAGRIGIDWNRFYKYKKEKDSDSYYKEDTEYLPTFTEKNLYSVKYENVTLANNPEYYFALQAYNPFSDSMIKILRECGFISDETWNSNKGKKTYIDFRSYSRYDSDTKELVFNDGTSVITDTPIDECIAFAEQNIFKFSEEEARDIYNNFVIEYNIIYGKAIKEGDRIFSRWLKSHPNPTHYQNYEAVWNENYNSEMHPYYLKEVTFYDEETKNSEVKSERMYDNSKFPIFLEYSKYFGRENDTPFSLQDSQIDAVKYYTSNKNAALLAHEVGFGKTIASICCIFHSLITGAATRPFVCVPSAVYSNFKKEIVGEAGSFRGLIPHIKVAQLKNARSSVLLRYDKKTLKQLDGDKGGIKRYSDNQIKIIDEFRKIKKAKGSVVGSKYNEQISLESDSENSYENFKNDFEAYLDKQVSGWRDEKEIRIVTFNKFDEYYNLLREQKDKALQKDMDSLTAKIDQSTNQYYALIGDSRHNRSMPKLSAKAWLKIQKSLERDMQSLKGVFKGMTRSSAEAHLEKELAQKLAEYIQSQRDIYNKKSKKADYDYAKRLASFVNKMLDALSEKVYDALGYYESSFLAPNTIVIASHTALPQFEITTEEAIAAISDVSISSASEDKFQTQLSIKPVSFSKLNTDMIVVDEIHNFNEYYHKAEKIVVNYKGKNQFAAVDQSYGKETSNLKKKVAVVSFNTKAANTSATKVVLFNLLQGNYRRNIAQKNLHNNLILSATPFVDSLYQMISVFSMLKPTMRCVNFFNNFCYEEYSFGQGSKGEIKYLPNFSNFKNKGARNQFIKSYTQFYTFDKRIDEKRPRKFIFPYVEGEQVGNEQIDSYVKSSSIVPLSDEQYRLVKAIGEFLNGNITYEQIAPLVEPKKIAKRAIPDFIFELEALTEALESNFDEDDFKSIVSEIELLNLNNYDSKDEGFDELQAIKDRIESSCKAMNIDSPFSSKSKRSKGDEEDDDENSAEIDVTANIVDDTVRLAFSAKKQQRLCLSPYMLGYGKKEEGKKSGWAENANLPPLYGCNGDNLHMSAKVFVENSPKILFSVQACIESIRYQEQMQDDISGQILFINDQKFVYGGELYDSFELIKEYLKKEYSLNGTYKVSVYDDELEQNVDIQVDEVEFIRGTNIKEIKKKAVELAFNTGKVKVLLGSSSIKEGINLQGMNDKSRGVKHGTSTIYVLTPDYQPMPFMQLEGRAWRQGNPLDNVRIVYVLHKNSIDKHIYSRLKTKIMQVKNLLEAGVYETNTTQFQQDIQGVSEYLITDIEKKVEVKWKDKEKEINKQVAEIDNRLERAYSIKNNHKKIIEFVNAFLPFINTMVGFNNYMAIARVLNRVIERPNVRSESPLLEEFYNRWVDVRAEFEQEVQEVYTNPIKKDFAEVTDAWEKRKKEFESQIKMKVKALKDEKDALKTPSPKIEVEIEKLNLMKFSEVKPSRDGEDYRAIEKLYIPLRLEAQKRRNEKFAKLVNDYGNTIISQISNSQLMEELKLELFPYLDENSESNTFTDVIKGLRNSKYIFSLSNRYGDELYGDSFSNKKNYKVSVVDEKIYDDRGNVVLDVVLDFSLFFSCVREVQSSPMSYMSLFAKKNEGDAKSETSASEKGVVNITNYNIVGTRDLEQGFFNLGFEKNRSLKDIVRLGQFNFHNRPMYFNNPSYTSRTLDFLSIFVNGISGFSVCDQLSNYESLVLKNGQTIDDIDTIIAKLEHEKGEKSKELDGQANFKDKLRNKYIEKDLQEKKERESLTSLFEFVAFEVQKFTRTNDMIYFRSSDEVENNAIRKKILAK